jgi:hypothetical protein
MGVITGAGFAGLVAGWFMFRLEGQVQKLIDLIRKNNVATGLLVNLIAALFRSNGIEIRNRDLSQEQIDLLNKKGGELGEP